MQKVLRYTIVVLGFFFLIAGGSKVFVFLTFAETIDNFIPYLNGIGTILSIIIISAEVLGGIFYIINYKIVLFSYMFLFIISTFITVLSISLVLNREINCRCFGVINFNFSNQNELILDFILLDIIALIIFVNYKLSNKKIKLNVVTFCLIVLFGLYIEYNFISVTTSGKLFNQNATSLNMQKLIDLENHYLFKNAQNPKLFLLIDFDDFNCPPCFDDFIEFNDALNKNQKNINRIYAFFVFNENDNILSDSIRLEYWKQRNNFKYSLFLIPYTIFESINLKKSSAILLDNGRVVFNEIIPMGKAKHQKALNLLNISDE